MLNPGYDRPTFGQRIAPVNYPLSLFLSPPLATGLPSNPSLTAFIPDFYVEGTFIYLTEVEMNQLARADQTYLVKTVKYVNKEGQFGGNTDLEIPMFNLVTRLSSSQRSDLTGCWSTTGTTTRTGPNPNRAPVDARSRTDVEYLRLFHRTAAGDVRCPSESAIIDGLLMSSTARSAFRQSPSRSSVCSRCIATSQVSLLRLSSGHLPVFVCPRQ
jgi:hypothetical protein